MTEIIAGTVHKVARKGTTVYGNAIVDVTVALADGSLTGPVRITHNSGMVYGIDNPHMHETSHVFTLTPAGRIRSYERCDGC